MEKRTKRKFKIKRFLISILIIALLIIFIDYILNIKTKNIVILNNNYYSDEEIIEQAALENYPKFVTVSKSNIKKKLKQLDLIEDVKIYKKFGFILKLDIKEKKILYLVRSSGEYKLSDKTSFTSKEKYVVPTLINFVPKDVEEKFISELSKLDINTINLISEIEYNKTEYDNERFLLYMNDGNQIYINNDKIHQLSKYQNIISKLGGKKGILYLDTGNYFEIKEK